MVAAEITVKYNECTDLDTRLATSRREDVKARTYLGDNWEHGFLQNRIHLAQIADILQENSAKRRLKHVGKHVFDVQLPILLDFVAQSNELLVPRISRHNRKTRVFHQGGPHLGEQMLLIVRECIHEKRRRQQLQNRIPQELDTLVAWIRADELVFVDLRRFEGSVRHTLQPQMRVLDLNFRCRRESTMQKPSLRVFAPALDCRAVGFDILRCLRCNLVRRKKR